MKETVVRLKSGEEIIYDDIANAKWYKSEGLVKIEVSGSQTADMYNIDEVSCVRVREKEEAVARQEDQQDSNGIQFEIYLKNDEEPIIFDTGIMAKIKLSGKTQSNLQITDILGRNQWNFKRGELGAVYIGKGFSKGETKK